MDLDLIRDILRRVESTGNGEASLHVPGHERSAVESHLDVLHRAGLVSVARRTLTAKGREFLRLANNDILWKRVLGELASAGRAPTLEAVNARLLEWGFMSG